MGHDEDLVRLEGAVKKLLSGFNELQIKNSLLEKTIIDKDLEITRLQKAVDGLQDDKSSIRDRVGSLISALEEFEQNQEEEIPAGQSEGEENGPPVHVSPNLFSINE